MPSINMTELLNTLALFYDIKPWMLKCFTLNNYLELSFALLFLSYVCMFFLPLTLCRAVSLEGPDIIHAVKFRLSELCNISNLFAQYMFGNKNDL